MHDHITEAMEMPSLIRVEGGLICARFETMKVLSASRAVRHLLESGAVAPGDTLIDSSSGIYANALALACHRYGMGCYIVGSTTVDGALKAQLEILGARFEQVRSTNSLELDQRLRVARIAEILAENPSFHWMQQYHDPIHQLGYARAAALIDGQVPPGPITLTGGVGSGASTAGMALHLRGLGREVRVVGVQPFGSVTFGSAHVADREIIIAGIGSSIEFRNVRHELYDRIHWVGFAPAAAGAIGLLRRAAIFAGLSTGAAYLVARWERLRDELGNHLFIAADTGHRYVDRVFARRAEFRDAGLWVPTEVAAPSDLEAPWSAIDWAGRAAPPPEPAKNHGGAERQRRSPTQTLERA